MKKERKHNKLILVLLFILAFLLLYFARFERFVLNDDMNHINQIEPEVNEEEKTEEDNILEVLPETDLKQEEIHKPVVESEIITSNIIIKNKEVMMLVGDNYNLYEDLFIDTGRNLVIDSNITDTTLLTAGTHQITYTAIDINGELIYNTRDLIVLEPLSDEDNDGYTNEEEFRNNINPMNNEDKPEYTGVPTIDISTCPTHITVYSEVPDFTSCVKATDDYYEQKNLDIKINTSKINYKKVGTYQVNVEVSDVLENKATENFGVDVDKKTITIIIDNKESKYSENIKELTSNEDEVEVENEDVGVVLSTTATKSSSVGTYPITGTWTNTNYEVTFINGTYTITKTVPEYKIPTGLTAEEGSTLADIVLPQGFTFQGETTTKLDYGTYETLLTYTPEDLTNYEIVKDIKAEVVMTPIPSNIVIATKKVVLLQGDNYDIYEGVSIDTGRNLTITASLNDTTALNEGTHTVTYSATDVDGRKITNQRTIVILNYLGDEDNDDYTNEEEVKNNTNPLDKSSIPNYTASPIVDTSTCPTNMTVYSTIPSFENCVIASDEYYNKEHLTTTIDTSNIDINNAGTYEVTIKVYDVLRNEKVNKIKFTVSKKVVTINIDNKTGTYLETLKQLTSNAAEATIPNTNIGVILSTTATSRSTVGTYPITGTWTNKNYEVTFVNGTYTITKAIPKYEIPASLTAEEDSTLETIALPDGFAYQTDATIPLEPGTYEILLTYTPEDTTNYEIIRNIKSEVVITPKPIYTITFVSKDNNVLSTQSVKKGESAIEPEINVEEYEENNKDYVFGGWIGNYIEVTGDATIRPLYIEESTSTTYAYVLNPKYYMPDDGFGYPTSYYTNALEGSDGSKIPLSIKIGGLTEEQAQSIQNKQTTIVALNDKDIFKYLTQSTKDQLNAITYGTDDTGSYRIEWYVLKFQPDGWHLDGYKIYDELTIDFKYSAATSSIKYSHLKLNFVNAVDNLKVEIEDEEQNVINSTGNEYIGNEYIISYSPSSTEKTIKITYSFKGIEYTKEYTIVNQTIKPIE